MLSCCFCGKSRRDGLTTERATGTVVLQPPDLEGVLNGTQDVYAAVESMGQARTVDRASAMVNLQFRMVRNSSLPARQSSGLANEVLAQMRSVPAPLGRYPSTDVVPSLREFKRLTSSKPGEPGWTHSRRALEVALELEMAKEKNGGSVDRLTDDQRLANRLYQLGLTQHVMEGDGNCQFRALAFGLYGDPSYHGHVRALACAHIRSNAEEFTGFLGDELNDYVEAMERDQAYGDELTLRAVVDDLGIIVNVLTSAQKHWFMRYAPAVSKVRKELFVTFIESAMHYNALTRPHSALLSNSFTFPKPETVQQSVASETVPEDAEVLRT